MKQQKDYTGSAYIGVVGSENEIGECRDSIEHIRRRAGDEGPHFVRATKGYEARQMHLNNWYNDTSHEFMLLLDHDQVVPPDILERLRSHKLPFVSGYYLRRRFAPIAPVWFEYPRSNYDWPRIPWTTEPERGVLHKLGASGWGCILIHRDVVTATRPLLKGEPEIIEDDMDVWPYDLSAVMGALKAIRAVVDSKPRASTAYPALDHHLNKLEREIKPLRGIKTNVGSDLRYPFFAREAGYTLYGDPDARVGHMLNYPLNPDDYTMTPEQIKADTGKQTRKDVMAERKWIHRTLAELGGVE